MRFSRTSNNRGVNDVANDLVISGVFRAPIMAALEASEHRWLLNRPPEDDDKLPSPDKTRELKREIEAVNAPIATADLQKQIGRMVSSFPQRGPDDSRGYILALAEHVGEFPADVVVEACRRMVRSSKFLPSVAEVIEACETLAARRRRALAGINAVESVRARQIEAREKAAAQEASQARERALHRAAMKKLSAALTAEGITPMDNYSLGIGPSWFRPLYSAAVSDVQAEQEGRPFKPELPCAVAAYVYTSGVRTSEVTDPPAEDGANEPAADAA